MRTTSDRGCEGDSIDRCEGEEIDSSNEDQDALHLVPVRCVERMLASSQEKVDKVAEEARLDVIVNSRAAITLRPLPPQVLELLTGFLVCEGYVQNMEEIVSLEVEGERAFCRTSRPGARRLPISPIEGMDFSLKLEDLMSAMERINLGSRLWRLTGATHSSMIVDGNGRSLTFSEDVSRSCAVDKAVGSALLEGIDLSRSALLTTGRLSEMMVMKAARAGIPIVASRASALASGIFLAKELNMTLAAFVRSPAANIYAGEERIR